MRVEPGLKGAGKKKKKKKKKTAIGQKHRKHRIANSNQHGLRSTRYTAWRGWGNMALRSEVLSQPQHQAQVKNASLSSIT